MEPFVRLVWKSLEDQNKYSDKIRRAASVYSKVEMLTFLKGWRKVITFHMSPDTMDRDLEFLSRHDLVFIPIRRSKMYSGFSHKHITPRPGDPYFIYGVVSRREDMEYARMFKECSVGPRVDHETIGKLLGYPECCIDFFTSVWGKVVDPIYEAYGPEAEIHPACNQALRYFGLRMTPHLCCSPKCERTIEMGKRWFRLMKEVDEAGAKSLLELLSMPFRWDCLKGVAIIDTPIFKGVTNSDLTHKRKVVINRGWHEKWKI